jgi:hypothetical protein
MAADLEDLYEAYRDQGLGDEVAEARATISPTPTHKIKKPDPHPPRNKIHHHAYCIIDYSYCAF